MIRYDGLTGSLKINRVDQPAEVCWVDQPTEVCWYEYLSITFKLDK